MAGDGVDLGTGGFDTTGLDPSAGIGAAPPVAPTDPLMPAGVPGATNDPFSPAGMTTPMGVADQTLPEAFGADLATPDTGTAAPQFADTDAGLSGAPGGVGSAPDQGTPPPGTTTAPTTPAPSAAPGTGGKGADTATSTEYPYTRPGTGAAGAGGANAVQSFANALRGLSTAAQGGNPQAAQLMNMIRQMMMQQQMQGMMGQGQQYNPYMNQFLDPRMMARMRMEQMRRRMLERQILAGQRGPAGTAAGMNPRGGGGTFGGGRRGR